MPISSFHGTQKNKLKKMQLVAHFPAVKIARIFFKNSPFVFHGKKIVIQVCSDDDLNIKLHVDFKCCEK